MLNKHQGKLNHTELEKKIYPISCEHCRKLLCLGNITQAIIEFKCTNCSRYTVISANEDYLV